MLYTELTLQPEKPTNELAYVWLFMKGDFYLPGIFTSVFSVLRTNPNADLVVMVTDDVSEHARKQLKLVATHLFNIPYLTFESKDLKTERQRELYKTWASMAYSKWNCLALPYKKVVLIDGDTINTENTDELFELHAPALPLASPFVKPLGTMRSFYHGEIGRDGYPVHGAKIEHKTIHDILYIGGNAPISTPALIEPSMKDYEDYIAMVKSMEPFGFPACNSALDEQSIAYFYMKKSINITSIHHRYNYYPWKDGFLFRGDVPRVIHFFSDTKPWTTSYNTYDDITTWYKMAGLAVKTMNITPEDINIKSTDVDDAENADDKFMKKFINVKDVLAVYGRLKISD